MAIPNKIFQQRAVYRFLAIMQTNEVPDTAAHELRELLRDLLLNEITPRNFHENLHRLVVETINEIDEDEGLQITMSF